MNFITPGYDDLELSTQLVIREATERGYLVDVLDNEANFIRISGQSRTEYIKQATRTRADSYISPIIMENKKVSKLLLQESGIRVPRGKSYDRPGDYEGDYLFWQNTPLVVKPNTTNFGVGITMFPDKANRQEYSRAGNFAFGYGKTVLAEEYIPGEELRFLVIGGYVRGVLKRVPANVVGDGVSDIRTLVEEKNKNPLRGSGYVSPLEKISLGESEREYLARGGIDFDHIPGNGEQVFLRSNSNISTGGDSLDVTDEVHPSYHDLAAAAAEAVGARICGVDMIGSDFSAPANGDNYSVIEVNFNPALHIHSYPYEGKNRGVEKYVLDLLGL